MGKQVSAALVAITAVIAALLAVQVIQNARAHAEPELTTPYQAVLLTNGQAFFGKLENAGTAFPVLRDVYVVRGQVNQETKQVTGTLVKRGNEPHSPDRMILNGEHILVIEPVKPGSQIAKLIEEIGKQAPESTASQLPAPQPQPEEQKK